MFARRSLIRVVFALGLMVSAAATDTLSASQTDASASEEQIKALERQRHEAFIRGDVDFLDRQTADDYISVNAAGAVSTKRQMMDSLRVGTMKVQSYELADLRARVFGTVAMLTGIYRDVSSVNGRARRVNVRFTRTFVNEGGTWRAVAYQQTPIPE